ncbi:MAG: hypothetical protein JWP12_2074 [Bacteroidetes bacterium]|nr:hypothetical protein [Bacteroidota bacterium]
MKLEKIIIQLKEKNYQLLCEQLKVHKGDKYLLLLDLYRQNSISEKEIQSQLDIKPAAFYTLKSRLYDKIQEFLYKATSDTRIELLSNVGNIEYLIYKAPKETATGILQKLETELIKNDMPSELIMVYKALKKLHVYSPKYYDYEQLYNKYVAYNLAQDKAEEVLSSFCKVLLMYYASRDHKLLDILILYKKEMQNLCRIHQSHRLTVYKNILNIHFALFSPVKEELKNDPTIEDLLKETYLILETHTEDQSYIHLVSALHFLSFEYYHQLKLHKNAATFYDKLSEEDNSILLYNHACFSIHFLISRIEWNYANNSIEAIINEEPLEYVPIEENTVEQIINKQYLAAICFHKGNFSEGALILNSLINDVSFKEMLHLEIETKLFMILLLLLCEKPDLAETTLRSISRKIPEDEEIKHHTAMLFIKLFKTALTNKVTNKLEKLKDIEKLISVTNTGPGKILAFMHMEPQHLVKLSKL